MNDPIKPGDVVAVGGAVTVTPESCRLCGSPASEFEARRAADPMTAGVDGYCQKHAGERRTYSAWYASVGSAVADEISECGYDVQYYRQQASDPSLDAGTRDSAKVSEARAAGRLAGLKARHGYPEND